MKPTDFAFHLTEYLSKYLPGKTGMSKNTIYSYRDTFTLLLRFCSEEKSMAIEKIRIETLRKNLIEEFLSWLESDRRSSIATRNQRLAAIHAFFRYLQMEEPGCLFQSQQILAIPMKRSASKPMNYLTFEAMKTILEQPDAYCCMGRRDLVLLSLLYDTGTRVQGIADLVAADVRLEDPPTIKVAGKGNKTRIVPLMSPTAKLLDQYMTSMI